jgi:OOP family OmpA-OmpF porin
MWALLVALVALAMAADVEGSADHPVVSRFAGSEIVGYAADAFDAYSLPLGPQVTVSGNLQPKSTLPLEGAVTRILYLAPEDAASLEVFKSYSVALGAAGFETLFACDGEACGGQFRRIPTFERELVPYAIRGRIRDTHYLAARVVQEGREVYVSVMVAEHLSPEARFANRAVAQIDVVEVGEMRAGTVVVDADAMARDLATTGRVALYGVFFDTGSAVLQATSDDTLAEIAALMKRDAGMKLLVVGHTDMTGTLAVNLDLSKRRAQAVVAALVGAHGIDASRLEGHGVGPLAPVDTNASDAGRARNRRVELVVR